MSCCLPCRGYTAWRDSRTRLRLANGYTTGNEKADDFFFTDKKAREAMASQAKGKGPMNTGQQGIKKSGKK
jgi:hypothetical protein